MTNKRLDIRIAFVAAEWHKDLVNIATDSCLSELSKLGVDVSPNVEQFNVPGSLEIPLVSKHLIQNGKWDAVITFGLIVDGGIYRHEFVAQTVLNGIMSVSLETQIPVLSVVLTPQKFDENNTEHIEFFSRHLVTKGIEAARAAIKTITEIRKIKSKS